MSLRKHLLAVLMAVFVSPVFGQSLFTDETSALPPRSDLGVTRQKTVKLNHGYLTSQLNRRNGQVGVFLFDGQQIFLNLRAPERRGPGNFTWLGKVEGYENSEVILTFEKGEMSGTIRYDGKLYQLRPGKGNIHWFQQVDPALFPTELEADFPNNFEISPRDIQLFPPPIPDVTVIDILVAYTTNTATRAGTGITSEIQHMIDVSNAAYVRSNINIQLRLAHVTPLSYTEGTDFSGELSRLASTNDGFMDEVHALRNTYGADMVSLIVENGQYCGIAYIGPSQSSFSVVNRGCASGNLSFPHELGHNMGARHDVYVDSSAGYNHGWINTTERWRTIMAYNNGCSAAGTSCSRLGYFSNPRMNHPSTGSPLGDVATADNARRLNESAASIASNRGAVINPPPPIPTPQNLRVQ